MNKVFLAPMVLATCALFGMTSSALAGKVQGTATYRERIAVTPGAVLEVKLVDVSRADAKSITLSSQLMALKGVPQAFELTYDDALIDERMRYNVEASVTFDGKLMFRNTSAYPVLTQGNDNNVEIVMQKMSAPAAEPASLEGTEWEAFELGGRTLISDKKPTLTFTDDGMVGAYAGCNRYRGKVEIGEDSLSMAGPMAGTMMACAPPYDKLEKQFLQQLEQVTGYVLNGNNLVLTNQAGVAVMRMSRMN